MMDAEGRYRKRTPLWLGDRRMKPVVVLFQFLQRLSRERRRWQAVRLSSHLCLLPKGVPYWGDRASLDPHVKGALDIAVERMGVRDSSKWFTTTFGRSVSLVVQRINEAVLNYILDKPECVHTHTYKHWHTRLTHNFNVLNYILCQKEWITELSSSVPGCKDKVQTNYAKKFNLKN